MKIEAAMLHETDLRLVRAEVQPHFDREFAKRALDIVVSVIALVLLLPVMVLITLLIRATSPGSAIFRQTRVGNRGSEFSMLKFRTMYVDSDDRIHRDYVRRLLLDEQPGDGGEEGIYKLTDDPRITPIGRFLRRTSLDELPQLVNVLKGEMSLVGPRPVLAWEVELYKPEHHARFLVKPGVTGLWQVSGRNTLTMNEALDLDVDYIQRRTLGLDLIILVKTVPLLLTGRGAR